MYRDLPQRASPLPVASTDDRDFRFQEDEVVRLRDYTIILSKYRWTIVAFFLPVVLVGALYSLGKEEVYTATATLYLESKSPNITGVSDVFGPIGGVNDSFYKTQLDLLQSRSLAAQVIQDLGLDRDPRFKKYTEAPLSWGQLFMRKGRAALTRWNRESGPGMWLEALVQTLKDEPPKEPDQGKLGESFEFGIHPGLIDRYLSQLEIIHIEPTQLIRVMFRSMNASFSKEVANAHATTFVRTNLLSRFELTAEAQQFLEEKLAELKAKLEKSEEDFNRFRKSHAIVGMEKGDNFLLDRLRGFNTDLTQARSKRIELESLYRSVQQRDSHFLTQIIENPVVRQLKERISGLEMEKARLASTFTPSYPGVQGLQEQIDEARNRVNQEIQRIVRTIASDFYAAQAREEALTRELEQARQEALGLREKAIEAGILEREVESNRALYENVSKRSKEAELTGTAPISNMRVIDRADVPLIPDKSDGRRTLLLSAFTGLLGGFGLAFLRHYLDNSLNTPEDIARFLRLPTLGMVPDIRRLDKRILALGYAQKDLLTRRSLKDLPGEQAGPLVAYHPFSYVNESYQSICTALFFSLPQRPPRTILITSAQPKEGKTATAANVALTLAQSGASVLLIDADLRNGHCHRLLSLENGSGLTQALAGDRNASEFIKRTAIPNLSLLSRGAIPPNPARLLGSEKMQQILASLERDFAFIIVDSAPILPISDTVLISTKVDGVLLVVRAQEASRYIVRHACERLAYVNAKVLGVILNGINMQSPEYKDYRSSHVSYYASYTTARS
jgi:polysaccharide biosynthesis transport protein